MSNPHIKTKYIRDLYANELYQAWRALDGHHLDLLYTRDFYGYKSGLETAYHRIDQRISSREVIVVNNPKYSISGMAEAQDEKIERICERCGNSFNAKFKHYRLCNKCYKLNNAGLEFSIKTRTGDVGNSHIYVYLIKDTVSGLTKIGESGDVKRRFKQIKWKTPSAVLVAKFLRHLDHDCEKELHAFFDDKRVKLDSADGSTEWFSLSDEDITYILHSYLMYDLKTLDADRG